MDTKDLIFYGKSAPVDIAYEDCFLALCIIMRIEIGIMSSIEHQLS